MSFPWMNETARRASRRDLQGKEAQVRAELAQRASMYYRLHFSRERALERLRANVAWDFESSRHGRPSWLSDGELQSIVDSTYKRRPA